MNIFKTITDAVSRQKSFDKTLQSKKTFIAEVEPKSKHEKQGESKASAKVGQPSKPKTTARRTSSTRKPSQKKPGGPIPVDPVGFKEFGLRDEILRAIGEQGYANPTPIQKASVASLVEGRDLLGCAQTGTGKTAAFALPTLQRLSEAKGNNFGIRLLVLTPTRELALQVSESYRNYGKHLRLKTAAIFGGVGAEPQKKTLRNGVDILVATPGRLLDLQQQGFVKFNSLEILVLDEADRMLDMGFLPDVKRIIRSLPKVRQNLLFSATMPKDIEDLSMNILRNPIKVEVARVSSASERVEQSVYFVNRTNKRWLLLKLLEEGSTSKVLVFTRTKAVANRIAELLVKNEITAEAIHGNKSQSARQRALDNFKAGKTRILVASDLAARGLDVEDISHVINYDVPNEPETYVHRIGRTGRAQSEGKALSLCDGQERSFLRDIERLIKRKVPVVEDHPFPFDETIKDQPAPRPQRGAPRSNRNRAKGVPSRSKAKS